MSVLASRLMIAGALLLVGMPHLSYAVDPTITVTFIGNQTCTLPASGTVTGTLTIAPKTGSYTCGAYTIRPKDTTKDVTVEALNDNQYDTLKFLNAKISRSSGTYPDLQVIFSAGNYVDPPQSGPTTDAWYHVKAAGFFKRDTTNYLATGSYIKTRGYTETPPGTSYMLGSDPPSSNGVELQFTVCGTTGCSNYLPTTYHAESHFTSSYPLDTNRVLKAELWVKLNNNADMLSLDYVNVQDGLPAGKRCDPLKEEGCAPACPSTECVKVSECLPTPLTEAMCDALGLCSKCGMQGPFEKKTDKHERNKPDK